MEDRGDTALLVATHEMRVLPNIPAYAVIAAPHVAAYR